MTTQNTTKGQQITGAKVAGDAKPAGVILPYRLHVRDLAAAKGYKVVQTTNAMDTFTKGTETIQVVYGTTQVVSAHLLQGDSLKAETGKAAKLQAIWGWIEQGKAYEASKKFNLSSKVLDDLKARVAKGEVAKLAK